MKKFFITTAIDYVNGRPHIGHALEKVQADVLARFARAQGRDTFFLTGTDEHGAKNVQAAEKAGVSVQEFVDRNSEVFRDLLGALNIANDAFIRTSSQDTHWPAAQKLWRKLEEAGDLYKKNYQGLYCIGHEAFVTEKDLENGKCRDHGTEPEVIEEENYFFRLSKYTQEIESRIKNDELRILPESRKNEVLALLERGLEDVSFSRPSKDLSWGVPVPGDESHTMYVWADALSNYISAIGYAENSNNFEKYWPADVHLIGKDILRFHAAIWPGMLLSAGLPLPKALYAHGHISIEGEKMSKTKGNVIDPFELVKEYGTDAVRYYLVREIPSRRDGDFSQDKFEQLYNGDLANGLGNFIARAATLIEKEGSIPGADELVDSETQRKVEQAKAVVAEKLDAFRLNEAVAAVWELISFGDAFLNEHAPWQIDDEEERKRVLANVGFVAMRIGELVMPFLPEAGEKIASRIVFEDGELSAAKDEVLFPRLTPRNNS